MKTIIIELDNKNKGKLIYTLSSEINIDVLNSFKLNYHYMFEREIANLKAGKIKKLVFQRDLLFKLSSSYTDLLSYMKEHCRGTDVATWNFYREQAKTFYTFPVINRLDASGFINQILC